MDNKNPCNFFQLEKKRLEDDFVKLQQTEGNLRTQMNDMQTKLLAITDEMKRMQGEYRQINRFLEKYKDEKIINNVLEGFIAKADSFPEQFPEQGEGLPCKEVAEREN